MTERTSKKVAAIASRILRSKRPAIAVYLAPGYVAWADIRALAASALTQTADRVEFAGSTYPAKPKRKAKKHPPIMRKIHMRKKRK
jgi:hypothetical protein